MVAILWRYLFFFLPFSFPPWFSSLFPFLTWKHLVSHWWFPCLPALPNNWGHKHPYCNQNKMISNDCAYFSLCTCQQRLLFCYQLKVDYNFISYNFFIEHFSKSQGFLSCLHWTLSIFWMGGTSKSIPAGYGIIIKIYIVLW